MQRNSPIAFGQRLILESIGWVHVRRETWYYPLGDIPAMTNHPRSLTKSGTHWILGGVCGGIAEYLGWPPANVRLLYVLLSVVSAAFPGILVYIILWICMPQSEN